MRKLTREELENIIENIVDAVENFDDRDTQFEVVETILIGENLIDLID